MLKLCHAVVNKRSLVFSFYVPGCIATIIVPCVALLCRAIFIQHNATGFRKLVY